MRIDVITIFPEIIDVLDVSLIGKARRTGLLDVRAVDLRDFTHDRHRTVDDTPYGGGAGMVMRPEPWGEALDAVLGDAAGLEPGPLVVFLTPAGARFDQAMARRFAAEERLVFCCGRYEGIDQRVVEHTAGRTRVLELSIGDFVLNGGEVAALAVIEATARLVPGLVGNPASLVEESHEGGLLEAPSYTKPAIWRELPVPPVLLSGDHGAVSRWRAVASLERTARVRPDLVPPDAPP